MFDRMSIWLGTALVTAGVSASLLVGAGAAVAATDPAGGGTTSTSAESADSQQPPRTARPKAGADDKDSPADESAGEAVPASDAKAAEPDDPDDPDDTADTKAAEQTDEQPESPAEKRRVAHARRYAALRGAMTTPDDTEEPPEAAATPEDDVVAPESTGRILAKTEPTAARARLALVPTAETPTARASVPRQTLLSLVGTAVFNLYSSAIGVLGGPPLLPRGSTVTVRSSSVTIDCGDGYEVPADWYVPEGPTPTRLVYLQHGFLAAGPFYSYTASRLAEATDSIVVTTSLTSNFLACDGCWVGGSPMHKAVADLFLDGNTALADSALAAGYSATLLNGVDKVVLIGHSAGGGLAAGAARLHDGERHDRPTGRSGDARRRRLWQRDAGGTGQAARRRGDLQPVRKVLFLEHERRLEHRPPEGAIR